MAINILDSTPIRLSRVPHWVESNIGFKPNRSTVFRWATRGARNRKLATFNAGGRKFTTVEALLEFFGIDNSAPLPTSQSNSDSEAYLESEGL